MKGSARINPHKIGYRLDSEYLYWATIRYSRHWLLIDGPESFEVMQNGMEPDMLQRIAIRYNVMRGIVGKEKNPKAQIKLCDHVNRLAKRWPESLLDRANACAKLVGAVNKLKKPCFNGFQGSATTKFMWFIKPDDWTVFDQYAATGLGVTGTSESGGRMLAFYKALQDKQIPEIWTAMQKLIDRSSLRGLPAPRIVDSFLMTKGGRGEDEKSIRLAKFAMGLLSKETALSVHNLAETIHANFASQLDRKLK